MNAVRKKRLFIVLAIVAGVGIAVALALVPSRPPEETAPMLVVAYLSSYVVGAGASLRTFRMRVGPRKGSAERIKRRRRSGVLVS